MHFGKMPEANLNGIKIHHKSENDLTIYASKDSFRETMINILQNAIDACPSQSGEIFVCGKLSKGMIEISVSDNGKGIPHKDRKNIFSPFFTTKKKGSGIGLFSCKKFAEESGGKLTVSGKYEKGTKISLLLPKGENTNL